MINPIKPTLKSEIVPIILIVICLMASVYFYINAPEKVPTHWNYKGEIDGWSSKGFGSIFLPIVIVGSYLLILCLPMIDPRKERYQQFSKPYHIVKAALIGFLTLAYLYSVFAGLGYKLPSMNIVMALGIGILFIIIGNYLGKVKSNWFMGVRTPWTLSNEEVWNKTHRLSGKLFMLAGLISILGIFLPPQIYFPVFITIIIVVSLIPVAYSYWLYHKITKH